jgi:hypothetical protein
MKSRLALACLLCVALVGAIDAADCVKDSYGNVVCGKGQCAMDQYGKVLCAREGGGAVRDRYGVVRCGTGMCAVDDEGRVMCSSRAGGGAAMDSYGKVQGLGAGEVGSEARCEAPR